MSRIPTRRVAPLTVAVAAVLLGLAAAVAIPMRRGASLGEALAAFPQRVLWEIPIALLLPAIIALSLPLRPRWIREQAPEAEPGESGSLAAVAQTLRRASGGRISRARVIARLVRLATAMGVARYGVDAARGWQIALEEMQASDPASARFLQGEGLEGWTAQEFASAVRQTVSTLEQTERET